MAKSRKRFESETSERSNPAAAQTAADTSTPTSATSPSQSQSETSAQPQAARSRSADDYRERVKQRAYELYLSRGGGHGSDWEDWLAAEREVIANRSDEEPTEE